jgi:GDP-L-fucose synthase
MKKNTIFVAGHNGFVGRAIVRRLNFFGWKGIITASKKELDLKNQKKVFNFIKKKKTQ